MNEEQKAQVREILLLPICCANKRDKISRIDKGIKTGQKYYPTCDEDMSDFAIGFYEIVYQDILESNPILKKDGRFVDKEFAGDTMNSFNTIANITPGAGKSCNRRTAKEEWPEYLQNYNNKYHCLANFWLLPMGIGRGLSRTSRAHAPLFDYVDLFLEKVYSQIRINEHDREYYRRFKCWDNFADKHFLNESYVYTKTSDVCLYSNFNGNGGENFVIKALEKIEQRADCIAKSKYTEKLWKYFNDLKLL